MPRTSYLFQTDLGDPVSCVFVNDFGCLAGSMLGKVMYYSFRDGEAQTLAAFSDEGVRGLYLDAEMSYATLMDVCKGWHSEAPYQSSLSVNFRTWDRKNAQNVKHILQRGPWVLVLFPMSTTVMHVARQEHQHRSFKLFDYGTSTEVAPCDFDGEKLVLVDRSRGTGPPLFRIVHLERNHHTEVDNVPAADSVTLLKLWGANYLICAQNRNLLIYDYEDQAPGVKRIIRGQGSEIMAVDSQDPEIIASLDRDAVVKLWNGRTAECIAKLKVPDAHYHMGYPYYLCVSGHRLLLSADEGVFLGELDDAPAVP
mmetsp:Transcript_28286/g.45560  ORF Transcript_28286/g.45560 Transcript_28286/m.45560 type:complete len:311 (-) Transcript_28286:24-956(-)